MAPALLEDSPPGFPGGPPLASASPSGSAATQMPEKPRRRRWGGRLKMSPRDFEPTGQAALGDARLQPAPRAARARPRQAAPRRGRPALPADAPAAWRAAPPRKFSNGPKTPKKRLLSSHLLHTSFLASCVRVWWVILSFYLTALFCVRVENFESTLKTRSEGYVRIADFCNGQNSAQYCIISS